MRRFSTLFCAAAVLLGPAFLGPASLGPAVLGLAAPAAAEEPAAMMGPGEIRLTLKLDSRSISFPSTLVPLARKTMPFEPQDHAPTDGMRAAAAELAPMLAAAKAESAFVVTAYAEDALVAYRRARAVRGALIERHQIAAQRIVAAGRAAPGHVGGATIVDVHEIDPSKCAGCGPTPFRSIAYDSGAMRLVTMLPEQAAAHAAAPRPAQVQPAALPREARREAEPSAPPQLRSQTRAPATARTQTSSGDCPRPRIIIDDYYPGGPLVPCRSGRRGGG